MGDVQPARSAVVRERFRRAPRASHRVRRGRAEPRARAATHRRRRAFSAT
jgi:hypothetical protein